LGQKLAIGDCVVIALPEEQVLSSAAQVYLMPLFGLISFSALGQWLFKMQVFPNELTALGLGIIGGYLGFRLAKYLQKQGKHSASLQPKIIKVLPKASIA
jgi:sigma-E factor negative regulatory protein RseC